MSSIDEVTKKNPDGAHVGQSATDLVGFWGVTPIVQPTAAGQAAAGTTASTTTTPWGYATSTQADKVALLLDSIRTALVNAGMIKGS